MFIQFVPLVHFYAGTNTKTSNSRHKFTTSAYIYCRSNLIVVAPVCCKVWWSACQSSDRNDLIFTTPGQPLDSPCFKANWSLRRMIIAVVIEMKNRKCSTLEVLQLIGPIVHELSSEARKDPRHSRLRGLTGRLIRIATRIPISLQCDYSPPRDVSSVLWCFTTSGDEHGRRASSFRSARIPDCGGKRSRATPISPGGEDISICRTPRGHRQENTFSRRWQRTWWLSQTHYWGSRAEPHFPRRHVRGTLADRHRLRRNGQRLGGSTCGGTCDVVTRRPAIVPESDCLVGIALTHAGHGGIRPGHCQRFFCSAAVSSTLRKVDGFLGLSDFNKMAICTH